MFISPAILADCTWQAFERLVTRLASYLGYSGIRAVGQSNDGGADLIAHRDGKRWLFQIKRLSVRVGPDVLDRTLQALHTYRATVPVVVSAGGFTAPARQQQVRLMREGIPMQLWDRQNSARPKRGASRPGARRVRAEAVRCPTVPTGGDPADRRPVCRRDPAQGPHRHGDRVGEDGRRRRSCAADSRTATDQSSYDRSHERPRLSAGAIFLAVSETELGHGHLEWLREAASRAARQRADGVRMFADGG